MKTLWNYIFYFLITTTSILAYSACSQDDIPINDIPRPGSAGELRQIVDHAIQVDRERRQAIARERQEWFDKNAITGHHIQMIENGADLTKARIDLIQSAERSIYMTTYHIANDAASKLIANMLCDKAKRGVEVRIVTNWMSSKEFKPLSDKLKSCGAYVVNAAQYLGSIVYAVHQKLLIADGMRFLIGGSGYVNMYRTASKFSYLSEGTAWYDMDFHVAGPAACYFHRTFQQDFTASVKAGLDFDPAFDRIYDDAEGNMGFRTWDVIGNDRRQMVTHHFGLDKFSDCTPTEVTNERTNKVIPIFNNPYFSRKRPILEAHINAILASLYAEKPEIKLYAPYFVPGQDFINALLWARKNGIPVSIMTNSVKSNDEKLSIPLVFASLKKALPLIRAGVKIYLWNEKSTMHRKGGVFSNLAVVGSDNFDNRAQEYSSEAVIFSDDPILVNSLRNDFDSDTNLCLLADEAYVKNFLKKNGGIWRVIANLFSRYF